MSDEPAPQAETPPAPNWLYAPGLDERPDTVPETFWDAEAKAVRVDALGKSYAELQGRFGQKNDVLKAELLADLRKDAPETPEAYKIELDRSLIPAGYEAGDFDPASPLMAEARQVLHKLGATQDDMTKLVAAYMGETFARLPDLTAERAKLGEGADGRLRDVQAKLGVLVTEEDERGALLQMTATASGVKALERILARVSDASIPSMPGAAQGGVMTSDEMTQAMSHPDYSNSQKGQSLRARVEAALAAGVKPTGYKPRF